MESINCCKALIQHDQYDIQVLHHPLTLHNRLRFTLRDCFPLWTFLHLLLLLASPLLVPYFTAILLTSLLFDAISLLFFITVMIADTGNSVLVCACLIPPFLFVLLVWAVLHSGFSLICDEARAERIRGTAVWERMSEGMFRFSGGRSDHETPPMMCLDPRFPLTKLCVGQVRRVGRVLARWCKEVVCVPHAIVVS